jgi:hypothetical protein
MRWTVLSAARSLGIGALVLAAGCAARAQGGPPLITDDPETIGRNHIELNLALTAAHRPGEREYELPLIDFNYGVGDRGQLKFEIPWVFLQESGERARNGLGNSLVGYRYRFLDQKDAGVTMSTYPQVGFNNPTRSARRGLVERGAELFLPIEIAREFGEFGVNVELGCDIHQSTPDLWDAGLAIGRNVSDRVEALAEIHEEGLSGFRDSVGIVNLGLRWRVAPERTLLLSVGKGIHGPSTDRPSFVAYVGMQLSR